MLSLLASPLGRAAGVVLLALALCTGLYVYAYRQGGQAGKRAQLEATVAAMKNRSKIDDKVSDMDDYSVCIELGGLPDDCRQLRGVDANAEAE
jgi:hypothetical protein